MINQDIETPYDFRARSFLKLPPVEEITEEWVNIFIKEQKPEYVWLDWGYFSKIHSVLGEPTIQGPILSLQIPSTHFKLKKVVFAFASHLSPGTACYIASGALVDAVIRAVIDSWRHHNRLMLITLLDESKIEALRDRFKAGEPIIYMQKQWPPNWMITKGAEDTAKETPDETI